MGMRRRTYCRARSGSSLMVGFEIGTKTRRGRAGKTWVWVDRPSNRDNQVETTKKSEARLMVASMYTTTKTDRKDTIWYRTAMKIVL